jgi:hypothetical protein
MIVRRILFFAFLLGAWIQSASACTEAHVLSAAAQQAMEIAVPVVTEDFAIIGCEHRCECSAAMQSAQSAVPESGKSLLASYVEGASAFLISSNPDFVALALRTRASSYIARRSAQPPYLLVPRLRQ